MKRANVFVKRWYIYIIFPNTAKYLHEKLTVISKDFVILQQE